MNPTFTVNIAVYNQKNNIPIILEMLKRQTFKDFEVSITDDGSNDGTKDMMADLTNKYPFPLTYWFQEKRGFRLAASKNMGIKSANGKYFISLEGDIIPHEDLLRTYSVHIDPNYILLGVRHEIKRLPKTDELDDLSDQVFSLDFRLNTLRNWRGIQKPYMHASGCNILFPTQPLIDVGMWDEGYTGYGKDDYDVVMRMFARGVKVRPVIDAVAYHIDHPHGYSPESDERFYRKERELFP